ncbi:MAG: TonB-dependent receptor [Flavobacteriaceae bacterium]|nr:TonB-dependent receptor [Flavobacteriaceae bacterium]
MKFFLMFFVLSNALFAQNITLLDKSTNEPISNVHVFNNTKEKQNISDIDGVLNISSFKNDALLYFQHTSYLDFKIYKKELSNKQIIFLTPKSNTLEEVFISASKTEVKRSRIAQEIAIIGIAEIQKIGAQTAADLLAEIPGIKVQKSQFGGGSPVLRGMEANRILLVVDGVRMNNAIYRKGHLQNSISVSPNMLERTEVIFGPSSVMYGSDALGGIIHYITKKPKTSEQFNSTPSFLTRYSTVNNEFTSQAAVELQFKKWATYTSFSRSSFGDLKMGRKRSHRFDNWGLQPLYSNNSETFYNENPAINEDPEKQKNAGFSQFDFLQKFYIPLSEKTDLNINFQYSKSSDIPRFDRLAEYRNGTLKFAEWRYGPQTRLLISSQLKIYPNKKWVQNGTITVAYQDVKESRIQRSFGSLKRTYRNENVAVFSINADFEVPLAKNNNRMLSYGTEFTYNKVNSVSKGRTLLVSGNEITGFGENFTVQTRYADGGSSYASTAFYINYRQDLSKKETLNTGIRLTNTQLNATWIDETFVVLPNSTISLNNTAVTTTVGYVFKPTKQWQLNSVISSGFRSPNIDDVGKVREKRGLVTVPNINLRPEYAYNAEIGILKYFKNKKYHIGFSTYYTLLDNYIIREAFELNGNTTILFDGEEGDIIANINGGAAYIVGGTFTFKANFTEQLYGKTALTYTKGRAYDTGDPLSSIPPLFADAQFGYTKGKFDASLNFRFNAKKKFEDYNLIEGIDNIEQTPDFNEDENTGTGNPAWSTLNFDLKYTLTKNMDFLFGIDNIFDQHYKEFASGISAPGRNFSFSLIGSF